MYTIIEKKLDQVLESEWKALDYEAVPDLTAEDYQERIRRLWAMKEAEEYSGILIYADREHFSNVHYFTDLDTRFEEALLVLCRDREPIIVLGNENMGYSDIIPYPIEKKLYQSFSLMGQPNDGRSMLLEDLIRSFNLPETGKIGLIGWKNYDPTLFSVDCLVTDVPHYIVETLFKVVDRARVQNAVDLLADSVYGLKHHVGAKEIVQFEAVGTKSSRSTYRCIRDLEPGQSEIDASAALRLDGDPLNIHPNVNFGDKSTTMGLSSPKYHNKLRLGDFVGVGCSFRGANTHKSGIYAASAADIPEDRKDYIEKMAKPYYATIVRWYEMMRIGTACGDVWQMVEDWIGFEKFGIGLNPGHLGHTDEWTNSPFKKGSAEKIASGMVIQCDYTVMFRNPHMTCHVEDALVIADEALRAEVQALSPACWERIARRRRIMKDVLNIELPDEVLPLSDLAGICFPYMADVTTVFAKA